MAEWFYVSNGQQNGPVDEAHLRQLIRTGTVGPDDLVWAEGMPQWVAARAAPQLAVVPAMPGAVAASVPAGGGAVALSYASPVPQSDIAIEHDEGPFMKVGSTFSVPGGRWSGTAIVSPKAFYLMKGSRQSSAAAWHIGGLAGALLQTAFATEDDVRTCTVLELPEPVRLMLDRKGKKLTKDVVVLPRGAINHVKVASFNTVVTVRLDPDKFSIERGLFTGGKIKRFLGEQGWTLDQEMTPTAAPIHGRGLGRTFEEIQKRKSSAFKRVAAAAFAIVVIIVFIVLRVLLGH